jgi:uncharacterized protein YegL
MKNQSDLNNINIGRIEFIPQKAVDPANTAKRMPIIMLVDNSYSVLPYLNAINENITFFTKSIAEGISGEKYSVDFSIITFGDKQVNCKRDFDLIYSPTPVCIEICNGNTPLGSALFLAYKYAEKRKEQYKKVIGRNYRQPIFIIISDFDDNDSVKIDGDEIYKVMAEKFSELSIPNTKEPKLGIIKIPVASVNHDKMNALPGVALEEKCPEKFATALKDFFSTLSASVPMAADTIIMPGEDYINTDEDTDEEENEDENVAVLNDYLSKIFNPQAI